MQYLIVIEKTETGYSAYSPDLDGCVATGPTKHEVEQNMREAIEFHVEGLRREATAFRPLPRTLRILTCLFNPRLETDLRTQSQFSRASAAQPGALCDLYRCQH